MIFEKQDYQQECLENAIKLLKNFDFKKQDNLKECLKEFYKHTPMPVQTISEKLNLDILMETGTGKTFTYLNLIFELHKHFKQNKFIIFVPRKAILESVKQNIKLTKDYFYSEYKKHLKSYIYTDSKSQSQIIYHYIKNTDELSVLILTNSAIDKKDNLLNKNNENLFNTKSVFENIAALKPISILDEPHLLKGRAFNEYFSKLNSLYFRFGATFPKEGKKPNDKEFALSNMIYCLDSISAFRAYLVKQVKVHTIGSSSTQIFLKSYKDKKAIFSYTQSGIEKEQELRLNESFSQLNGATLLKVEKDKAYFSDQSILDKKGESYHLDEDELTALLGKAIDLHFEKEQRLFAKGIKALSLFFIPNIADFRGEKPFIKSTFEELYKAKREELLKQDLDENYRAYLAQDFDESGNLQVHQGYFSGDKGSKDDKEAAGVKMILEEKEKLLSLNTPLRFIFSVWALQEGWDNPNIFTLTKLAHSSSDVSRHQQVGRGLRLCVNDKGKRITHRFMDFDDDSFYRLNYLDIIVSAKESNYIGNLQKEIEDSSYILSDKAINQDELNTLLNNQRLASHLLFTLEDLELIAFDESDNTYIIQAPIYESIKDDDKIKKLLGESFDKVLKFFKAKESQSPNKHDQIESGDKKSDQVTIRPKLAKDFKELWEKINRKAKITYQDIKEQDIINQAAEEFNKTNIEKESYTYERKRYDAQQNIIITEDSITLGDIDYQASFAKDMQNLLLDFSKEAKLPLKFLLQIYAKCDKEKFKNSPKKAFTTLKNIINDQIHHNLLQCISYDFSTAKNESESIFSSGTLPRHTLGRYYESGKPANNYLYEEIVYDSKIERTIITEDNEKVDSKTIKVFAKLPKLSIPTPYKHYEPDFAYFLEDSNGKKIFFVCESKGYDDENEISKNEMQKIKYAEKFFTQLSQKLENDNIQIIFKKRINKQTLLDCLRQTQGENNAN
ncbi:DEAD/DEAH box helicase family protein [Campylobacter felis]|uniref:DEAD/DEAH box helicase family protein n=1 Tax=Campylobacter felis TaxID=2974565 RepID=A0ABT7I3M5_9BACT|nr:DEAD/DEAH box helicase family protein [Campylobacter upsaliensis]MDL0103386.1 DEAD/DEAH box helicase family protein [Campylobacter felis]MDL0108160.1 DEAD/DEAH box helicase family protein [Campylobacter felis]MDL0146698.1 DEAD/DEAH box helicase family protein [Campylobacter felis]